MGFLVLHVICVQNTLGFSHSLILLKCNRSIITMCFFPPLKEPRKLCFASKHQGPFALFTNLAIYHSSTGNTKRKRLLPYSSLGPV